MVRKKEILILDYINLNNMLTIFTIPKPFTDKHIAIIQQNAIKSWILLKPACEIFLVGNDEGISEIAKRLNIKHLPNVKKNEFGTPLISSAINLVRANCKNDIIVYLNADIILMADFINTSQHLPQSEFLGVGRRWDLDVKELIDFQNQDWETNIKNEIKKRGILHSPAGIDYFIFRKESFQNMPEFTIGRVYWDNWMIYEARRRKMITIDATETITAIHQNHHHLYLNKGAQRKENPEAKKNLALTKGKPYSFTIEDTNYRLTENGLKKKWFPWIPFLKRYVRHYL